MVVCSRTIDFIAAEMGWGAKRHETQEGPRILAKQAGIVYRDHVRAAHPWGQGKTLDYAQRLSEVVDISERLSVIVAESVKHDHLPIVIGGDESIAIGTWSGIITALQASKHFGLLWIDAHMDAHTVDTTPSMAIHGMPVAALLGYGEPSLVNMCQSDAKLDPQHVVMMGVRSYEAGEAALLKDLHVKIYFMEEVKKRGVLSVMQEAIQYLNANTVGWGVNLDLDAFDPRIAPGVGSPENGGIEEVDALKQAWDEMMQQPLLKGIQISEYNPDRDRDYQTARWVKQLLSGVSR